MGLRPDLVMIARPPEIEISTISSLEGLVKQAFFIYKATLVNYA